LRELPVYLRRLPQRILSNNLSCAIVLPCYNPQPGWAARVIKEYGRVTDRIGFPVEIILVNDGSTSSVTEQDITVLRTAMPSFRYISYTPNKGKGHALRQGVAATTADIIIYTDVDFPYTTDSLVAIYHTLCTGDCDAAPGVKNKDYYAKVPALRRYISQALRFLTGIFFRIPVTDTQCGLKGFRQHVKPVFLATTIDRYLFDLEFIRSLYRKKYRVKTVPVELNDDVYFKPMNYRLLIPEMKNFIRLLFRN